jgi:PIN domain nuclease of toxin-antitoxin system
VRTVLDAYALIAFLLDEPAADDVERLFQQGPTAITSVNYAEVLDRLIRGRRMPRDDVMGALAPLLGDRLERIDVDFRLASAAGLLRASHYHRTGCPLSLADCVCLAAADRAGRLATADEPMLQTADAEGIRAVPLALATG